MNRVEIRLPKEAFNEIYRPLLVSRARYLVLCGGAGSGKSVFAVQRCIYRLLKEQRNLLVIREVAATNRDSTFALFKQILSKWGLTDYFTITETAGRIRCINGSEILFKGLDNSEKLKSVTFSTGELTDIWVEEASEIAETDFNQLAIRLRGGRRDKQVILTFNPVSVNHWLKRRFFDVPRADTVTLRTTYRDNRFLPKEDGEVLESFRETDPYYYTVYCLGEWGVTGNSIFDTQAVSERLRTVRSLPVRRGSFYARERESVLEEIRFCEEENGSIAVFLPPKEGMQYVIGADTAGDGSDYFAAPGHRAKERKAGGGSAPAMR